MKNNYISIAKETIKITNDKFYTLNEQKIELPLFDYKNVEIYSPERGKKLSVDIPDNKTAKITVTNEDSFQAAKRFESPLVMNFANAYCAGGGFLLGASAQEEALCRCSTLYASISSSKAAEMYQYNRTHISSVESDYILLSPDVCVFRNEKCELLEQPFIAGVITAPAPNRRGAAMLASKNKIAETFLNRIEIICKIAASNDYKNLILGAWGCGAFGNDPIKVAEYFHTILLDKGYAKCFDNICFAIYGKPESSNSKAFKNVFK